MKKNILIVKMAAAGDVLRTASLLESIKGHYSAEIDWLTSNENKWILKNNPFLRTVYAINDRTLINEIKRKNYDIIISLDEDITALKIVKKVQAAVIEGYKLGDNGRISSSLAAQKIFRMGRFGPHPENDRLKKHNKQTYQDLILKMLSINSSPSRPYLYLDQRSKNTAQQYRKFINKEYLVGLNFGSGETWPTKSIPENKIRDITMEINKQGWELVIFGGPSEEEILDKLLSDNKLKFHAVKNESYDIYAAMIDICDVLITTDTLALHIATALNKNIVALFGPTSFSEIELFGAGKKLYSDLDCLVCYRRICNKKPYCMDEINTSVLLEMMRTFLTESRNNK